MSKVNELIAEFCPDGAIFYELGALLDYEQPGKYIVSSTNYDDNFATPVLTAGQSFILGYTDETTGIYNATQDNPVIIFDDFTTSFHWVDFPFKVKSSAMKLLTNKDAQFVNFKYVFYTMQTINYQPGSHSRQWIDKYSKFKIPVPPIEVQREIVRILDHFTELSAELTAELTARKQQYEYYRNRLLTFDESHPMYNSIQRCCSTEVPTYSIGAICGISRGRVMSKDYIRENEGDYPVYSSQTENNGELGTIATFDFDGEYLTWTTDGANAGTVFYRNGKFSVTNVCGLLKVTKDELLTKYLYYILNVEAPKYVSSGMGNPKLMSNVMARVTVPVPPIEVQCEIVRILDNFTELTAELSSELTARKQQYEYYRDKLLTFKEIEA